MSFSQLSTELKNQILSYLVNVERRDCQVRVTHDYGVDGEQYIHYNLQPVVFGIDNETRTIVWDQMHTAVLVALYVDGGPELRPSLHVPVLTDHCSEAAQIAMASLRPNLRIGEVVIKTRSDPALPDRNRRHHFSLLSARSLATYLRILSTRQGGCLPPHYPGRLAPTLDNMLSATRYEVFIDISGYDNSKPGTLAQLLAAFEPLYRLGNVLHLDDREGGQRTLDEHIALKPQDALRQWSQTMYKQLLFVKQLVDSLYLGYCDDAFGCHNSVSVPLRLYDLALACFRFALALRSGRQNVQYIDQQWFEDARKGADQLAVCAGFSLLSIALVHDGSIHNALEHRADWPGSPDCGKHFCLCQIITCLGDGTESVFSLQRYVQYGLGKKTWLPMQHSLLVHHHLPDFDAAISHIETLHDDLRQLEDEMKYELGTGTLDLADDIKVLKAIKRQWRRSIRQASNSIPDTLPIELLEGEEVYDDDITQVVLQRLSVAKRRELLVLEKGEATLRLVSTYKHGRTLLESDFLGSAV